jgi:hypothetical protein
MTGEPAAKNWDSAKTWHLAQINVGRARGAMDSPVMAGFAAQLETINQLAESTPGFVWRLKDEAGDATSFRIFEDPMMMVNASVWESIEALRDFVYRSSHSQVMRGRAEWFEKPGEAYMALWWVPAGHIPTARRASGSAGASPRAWRHGVRVRLCAYFFRAWRPNGGIAIIRAWRRNGGRSTY